MTDKELFSAAMVAQFGTEPKTRRIMHNDTKIQEVANSKATVWFDEHGALVGIMVWPKN